MPPFLQIFSPIQALRWLCGKLRTSKAHFVRFGQQSAGPRPQRDPLTRMDECRTVLRDVVLAHVPVVNWNFRDKVVYLCLMLRRLILAQAKKIEVRIATWDGFLLRVTKGIITWLLYSK